MLLFSKRSMRSTTPDSSVSCPAAWLRCSLRKAPESRPKRIAGSPNCSKAASHAFSAAENSDRDVRSRPRRCHTGISFLSRPNSVGMPPEMTPSVLIVVPFVAGESARLATLMAPGISRVSARTKASAYRASTLCSSPRLGDNDFLRYCIALAWIFARASTSYVSRAQCA